MRLKVLNGPGPAGYPASRPQPAPQSDICPKPDRPATSAATPPRLGSLAPRASHASHAPHSAHFRIYHCCMTKSFPLNAPALDVLVK